MTPEDDDELVFVKSAGQQLPAPPPAPPKGPGLGRKLLNGAVTGGRMLLGLVAGTIAFVLTLGMTGLRAIGNGIKNFRNRPKQQKVARKQMGLRHAFFGAAVLAGALVGPGVYQMTQPNEIVTTRVTGKVEADADKEYPGRKFVLYTKGEGKLDTYGVSGGADIKTGCTYEFNLRGARLEYWPPGYTRSVQSFRHVPTPNCPGS